jgi:hypothetical protein
MCGGLSLTARLKSLTSTSSGFVSRISTALEPARDVNAETMPTLAETIKIPEIRELSVAGFAVFIFPPTGV